MPLTPQTSGVAFALVTAVMWAIGPMFMASAGRRIGALNVNLLRMALAGVFLLGVFLPLYLLARPGTPIPAGAQLRWLILSGVTGQAVGDFFFYEALVRLGPRRAIKMNMLAPVGALLLGWAWLHEALDRRELAGVAMVLGAIAYATFAKTGPRPGTVAVKKADPIDLPIVSEKLPAGEGAAGVEPGSAVIDGEQAIAVTSPTLPPRSRPAGSYEPGGVTSAGLICGVLSAACTAAGTVFGRKAFNQPAPMDVAVATVVRVVSAATVLWTMAILTRRIPTVAHLKNRPVMARILAGTVLGTLLGMFCYVAAMKHAEAGLVSTLVSTSPLVVIPLIAFRYRVRIPIGVVVATAIAVAGVGLISCKR